MQHLNILKQQTLLPFHMCKPSKGTPLGAASLYSPLQGIIHPSHGQWTSISCGGRGGGSRNIRSCFMQQAPVRVKHQPHALLVANSDFVLPVTNLYLHSGFVRKDGRTKTLYYSFLKISQRKIVNLSMRLHKVLA